MSDTKYSKATASLAGNRELGDFEFRFGINVNIFTPTHIPHAHITHLHTKHTLVHEYIYTHMNFFLLL